jgi:hypothetical protein
MLEDIRTDVLDAYPAQVDRTYAGAALLLAIWAIVFAPLAAFTGDDVSNWWAFFLLTGVAMLAGLWIEHQKQLLGLLLVVLPGIAISVLTFWAIVPIVAGLVLVVTCVIRVRADQRAD